MLKKIIIGVLAALLTAQTAFASGSLILTPDAAPYDGETITEVSPPELPEYRQIGGMVTEIRPYYDLNGNLAETPYYVLIEDEDGGTVNFVITDDTMNLTGTAPEVGDSFTGVFDGNMPVIMIYPPQYNALAFAVNYEGGNLFIPSDGKITVNVNGETIEAPAPYSAGAELYQTLMVPVRAIAEALGYEVIWEAETKTVRLNNAVSFKIGADSYELGRMAPIVLGSAPEIVNDRAYVPLNFFREVVKMNNAYVLEGIVEINNDEKMN